MFLVPRKITNMHYVFGDYFAEFNEDHFNSFLKCSLSPLTLPPTQSQEDELSSSYDEKRELFDRTPQLQQLHIYMASMSLNLRNMCRKTPVFFFSSVINLILYCWVGRNIILRHFEATRLTWSDLSFKAVGEVSTAALDSQAGWPWDRCGVCHGIFSPVGCISYRSWDQWKS